MPRPGPRRELLAVRIDKVDMDWIQERCSRERTTLPGFVRRMVSFAHQNMPEEPECDTKT